MGTFHPDRLRQQIMHSEESSVFVVGSLMLIAWLLAIAVLWYVRLPWDQWVISQIPAIFTAALIAALIAAPPMGGDEKKRGRPPGAPPKT